MSDEIYWIPVAVWSTAVFIQVDSAIRSWWMNRGIREELRRLMESDWSKLQRGETKRGFRIWLEHICCPKKSILEEEDRQYFLVKPPLPNDYDWNEWIERELMSIFVTIVHPMPNFGQHVLNLRRYSFFVPSVYTDIARVFYSMREGWAERPLNYFELDDRTVALTYENWRSLRICVVLIDIKQRSYRLLVVPAVFPPTGILEDDSTIRILYVRRGDGKRANRLRIVYGSSLSVNHEIISVDYEMRPSKKNPSRLFAVETGRQSISILGPRTWIDSYIPGTHILKATVQNQSSFVITIDQRGDFRLHHYDEWNQAVMATDIDQRSRKAISDFKAVLPEQWRDRCYFYQYYKHILGCIGDSFAKRQLYPPSRTYQAAEAICQAKPNADLSMIKSETGIDMFDGIYDDQEKPVLTIFLPSFEESSQDG